MCRADQPVVNCSDTCHGYSPGTHCISTLITIDWSNLNSLPYICKLLDFVEIFSLFLIISNGPVQKYTHGCFVTKWFSLISLMRLFKQEALTQKYIADEKDSRKRLYKWFPVYKSEFVCEAWIFATFNLLRKSRNMLQGWPFMVLLLEFLHSRVR